MNYKLYNEQAENTVYFRLYRFFNVIGLEICNEDGCSKLDGIILEIKGGKIYLKKCVTKQAGLELDEQGHVKVEFE